MADIANIAIQDGKATPLTHTFTPIRSGLDSSWRTTDPALPLIGQEVISVKFKKTGSGVNIVTVGLDLPALETATGANSSGFTAAPKVAYINRVKVEFLLPERGTASQRKDLRILLQDLVGEAAFLDIVDNVIPPN